MNNNLIIMKKVYDIHTSELYTSDANKIYAKFLSGELDKECSVVDAYVTDINQWSSIRSNIKLNVYNEIMELEIYYIKENGIRKQLKFDIVTEGMIEASSIINDITEYQDKNGFINKETLINIIKTPKLTYRGSGFNHKNIEFKRSKSQLRIQNIYTGKNVILYYRWLDDNNIYIDCMKVVNNVNNILRYTVSSYDDTVCTLKMTRYELDEFTVKSYLFGNIKSIKTSNGFDISTDIFA